jgi:hypothetical protein
MNGNRLLITRQRLVDLDGPKNEDGGQDNYAMTFKDFRAALAQSGPQEVRIKNLFTGRTLLVSFGSEYSKGEINIGCHSFEPKVYARILKASGFKPKAAAAAAGR